jgi:Flp pilus assembly pilin Flp
MIRLFLALLRDETGTSLAEYALVTTALGSIVITGSALLQSGSGTELNATATGWQGLALSPP